MLPKACHWMGLFWDIARNFSAGKCQTLSVTGPVQPVWSAQAIHNLWLLQLSLDMCGKDLAAHQGQLPPAPSLEDGQQKAQGTMRSASTC